MGIPDYRTLPDAVRLEQTVAGQETETGRSPHDVRNVDQHAALRDD